MNNVILMGRLTKDAEIRQATETMVATFTLAVDRIKQGEADFIRCIAFGKTAEVIDKYTSKGSKIIIKGRIQTGSYTNKDGQKVYTTDVVVENMEFAESKKTESNDGFVEVDDAELPF